MCKAISGQDSTANPAQPLHIYNPVGDAMIRLQTAQSTWNVGMKANGGNPDEFVVTDENGDSWFIINTMSKTITIGVPGQNHHSLAVQGKITAEEIKVKPDPLVPDYVFEEDYTLIPLAEVAAYVKAHKHLPGIPSAKEIEENNGVSLGEMSYKLLEKIEELTLYTLQQQKLIEELRREIENIKNK